MFVKDLEDALSRAWGTGGGAKMIFVAGLWLRRDGLVRASVDDEWRDITDDEWASLKPIFERYVNHVEASKHEMGARR